MKDRKKNDLQLRVVRPILERSVTGSVTMPSRRIDDPAREYSPRVDLGETFRQARPKQRQRVRIETLPRMAGHTGEYKPSAVSTEHIEYADEPRVPLWHTAGTIALLMIAMGVAGWLS